MSLRFAFAATLLASSVAFAPAAHAQAKQDFMLINKTGYTLSELYVSPAKSDDWQKDLLGERTLADGATQRVTFSRSATTCKWDLKVVYEDDDSNAVWYGIDLCEISRITIRYNRKTETTSASFD
jgi:hypothetical protein